MNWYLPRNAPPPPMADGSPPDSHWAMASRPEEALLPPPSEPWPAGVWAAAEAANAPLAAMAEIVAMLFRNVIGSTIQSTGTRTRNAGARSRSLALWAGRRAQRTQ